MRALNQLEILIEKNLKKVPHLPKVGSKWIATNVWWIVMIGVILSVIAAVVAIGGLFTAARYLSFYAGYSYMMPTYTGWYLVQTLVSLALLVLTTVLMAISIKPLSLMHKKGWNILFISILAGAAMIIINAVVSFNVLGFIGSIIFGAIGVAIGTYFLFEIKEYFKSKVAEKAEAKE